MRYLLDASALLPLVTKRGKQLIAEASSENLVTTDLAVYEACKSLWKLTTLLKTISLEDAVNVAVTMRELILRNIIQQVNFIRLDLSHTLVKASEEGLSFYDASYITIAESMEATLVTDDERLLERAEKFIKTITYRELEERLAH